MATCEGACDQCQTEPLTLLRTSDGGATWTESSIGDGSRDQRTAKLFRFGARSFVDDGSVFVSADNGISWKPVTNACPLRRSYPIASFADADNGLMVCLDGKAGGTTMEKSISRTLDGGSTWQVESQYRWAGSTRIPGTGEAPGGSLIALVLIDDRTAFIGEATRALSVTHDGGRTWSEIPGLEHYSYARALSFHGDEAFALFDSMPLKSDDKGEHWHELPPLPP